ncbi:hypothetical protein LXA47_22595 [Massilia sp. P8910]|uniref:hypothetical protein n=1 Tax=Massilia antarctica TaxID=2765360 RepID=UPI001E5CE977|nr:hypothetical protein [Massilia antarctica]MCE3606371.1 hypothetical protein [Massilia antarctica]
MANLIQESRNIRDRAAGRNLAAAIPVPELICLQGQDIRSRFQSLENELQRTGFLDTVIAKLNSNFGNWAGFYEAVDVVRTHQAYWKNKGYLSFDEFWRVAAGPCFRSFKELEDIYNFAKTACPELFDLDFEEARAWVERLSDLRAVPAAAARTGARLKKRHYADQDEAHAAVLQASLWYNAGSHSLEYRMARLKRDRPDIAAAVLAGRYFKVLDSGSVSIDLIAAECDAYGARPQKERAYSQNGQQPGKKSVEKVAATIRSIATSATRRKAVVLELSKIRWLVKALTALEREKDDR